MKTINYGRYVRLHLILREDFDLPDEYCWLGHFPVRLWASKLIVGSLFSHFMAPTPPFQRPELRKIGELLQLFRYTISLTFQWKPYFPEMVHGFSFRYNAFLPVRDSVYHWIYATSFKLMSRIPQRGQPSWKISKPYRDYTIFIFLTRPSSIFRFLVMPFPLPTSDNRSNF